MNKKKLLGDLMLILALLFVSLLVFLLVELTRDEGSSVLVTVDGEAVAEYSLFDDGEYSLNDGTNILVISNGCAYLKDASCPDRLCVNQGKISMSGERIVCLPNRVMIEILGVGEDILSN